MQFEALPRIDPQIRVASFLGKDNCLKNWQYAITHRYDMPLICSAIVSQITVLNSLKGVSLIIVFNWYLIYLELFCDDN
jgi:hypothetical protein